MNMKVATPFVQRREQLAGLMLGTAVGDALGLPAEGLSPGRIARSWPGKWQHRFIAGRGMWSDDTEHMLCVAAALLTAGNSPGQFQRELARRLRWWFAGLPAGVGMATARACLKLWLGVSPARSGVFSAGNGPAMRSALIGACFADDAKRRRDFTAASTRLTHTDPRALTAALAVAEAAAWVARGEPSRLAFLQLLPSLGEDAEWQSLCDSMRVSLEQGESVAGFARGLGAEHGVSGYAYHTVPVALFAWLRHPQNFEAALTSALDCGGDTDTVGAIVGALAGAEVGAAVIPAEWVTGIVEWPRDTDFVRRLADELAGNTGRVPPGAWWRGPATLPRNLLFLAVVLAHGVRRLLPPY